MSISVYVLCYGLNSPMTLVRREDWQKTLAGKTSALSATSNPSDEISSWHENNNSTTVTEIPEARAWRITTKHGARPSTTEARTGPAGPAREVTRREGEVRGPLVQGEEPLRRPSHVARRGCLCGATSDRRAVRRHCGEYITFSFLRGHSSVNSSLFTSFPERSTAPACN